MCVRVVVWLLGQWEIGYYKEKGTNDLITSPRVICQAGRIRIASLLLIAVAEVKLLSCHQIVIKPCGTHGY